MGGIGNRQGMLQLGCITLFIIVFGIQGHPVLNSEGRALFSFQEKVTSDPSETLENERPDVNLTPPFAEVTPLNRKLLQREWQSNVNLPGKRDSILSHVRGKRINHYFNMFPRKVLKDNIDPDDIVSSSPTFIQHAQDLIVISRRKLGEESCNLQAIPANFGAPLNRAYHPSYKSSGSFSAIPTKKHVFSPPHTAAFVLLQPPPRTTSTNPSGQISPRSQNKKPAMGNSGHLRKYIVAISGGIFLINFAILLLFICRGKATRIICPWEYGLSGRLQKAFVKGIYTGVPKFNRAEIETACEDFSNIIAKKDEVIAYKGKLLSGIEIAVFSTTITSRKDWSKRAETIFRKKINTMSQVNHKNLVNLIGYCEEEEPFSRMMVFEYAPNGALSEHLHGPAYIVEDIEHLDWSARMRILMGTAYCLQHMHNQKPPIAHSHVNSKVIYLTDDNAAKLVEMRFWADFLPKSVRSININDAEYCELPPVEDLEANVYDFGILLLELISGKPPHSVSIVTWASKYLNDKQSISYLIDPSLKSFKENELAIICEVIQECIQPNARKRPTMGQVTSKLRAVLDISPEFATPRLSPLRWAELEILST